MTIYLDEVDDGIQISGEPCPRCTSTNTVYDLDFAFWKCEDCSTVWAHDRDDPDYEEAELCPTCCGDCVVPSGLGFAECPTCDGAGVLENEGGCSP